MPATRLRNHHWHHTLQQVHERGGSLEIAIAPSSSGGDTADAAAGGADFIWRVRLLDLSDTEILVEQPFALGKPIEVEPKIQIVAIMAIGQNRWMFRTAHIGRTMFNPRYGKSVPALRLAMPENVERCQRRNHYRVETAALSLPTVDVWPLLDPKTVLVAERANELAWEQREGGDVNHRISAATEEIVLPEVGPKFPAQLMNLGGGGVGLLVRNSDSSSLHRHRMFWIRISLPQEVSTPICATAKAVHTHMSATQDFYAGMAFDFTFNPVHQDFVVRQIARYVAYQQRAQMNGEQAA